MVTEIDGGIRKNEWKQLEGRKEINTKGKMVDVVGSFSPLNSVDGPVCDRSKACFSWPWRQFGGYLVGLPLKWKEDERLVVIFFGGYIPSFAGSERRLFCHRSATTGVPFRLISDLQVESIPALIIIKQLYLVTRMEL
ncbi:unnamed protein product [Lactuca saligna]|uniref:Uncharacterized protein n=1 Tax=Lactuca saligna TaxID=75948 RepID=A0AA35YA71_LACSI|nr:unnamed protein product [Lactuca saligna]